MTVITLLAALSVSAQVDELPDPGITPDSPFYFLDRWTSMFQSRASQANERAAEVIAMAQEGHLRGLEKGLAQYEKAMAKREEQASKGEEEAEEVARQSTNHLAILAGVKEQVPEEALAGIDQAIERSTAGRENALVELNAMNQERARVVAQETLEKVMLNAPEAAKEGLQKALEAVQNKGVGVPPEVPGGQPEGTGAPDEPGAGGQPKTTGPPEGTGAPDEPGQPEGAGQGELDLLVSDAPADIADFDSLTVEFSKTRIFMGGKPIEKSLEGKSADLTQLVGEKALEILSTELDAGTYTKIELYVASVTGIVAGEEVEVMVPSDKLMITKNFEIVEGQETTFVFDINVQKKGQGGYNLLPVISESGVVGEDIDEEDVEEVEPTPECTLDEDCETGFACENNECEEVDVEESECTLDEDCETGFVCTEGACVEEVVPECTLDEDCETGFVCTEGACVEEVVPECILDEDCETGFVCTESVCVEEVVPECTLDEDCETGFVCTEGACVETLV